MKKHIFLIMGIFILFLVGCELSNIPTSKVEELLMKYQMLDDDISVSHIYLSNDESIDSELQKKYQKAIEEQYKSLSYEVKEEEIDGNEATVTVEIEVLDYDSVFTKYDRDNYSREEYHKLITEELGKVKEKVTYTVDFYVVKDRNDEWQVTDLTSENLEKLLGIYSK